MGTLRLFAARPRSRIPSPLCGAPSWTEEAGRWPFPGGTPGSDARGEADRDSDLDLLVDLPPGSSLLDLVGLQLELREALRIDVDANTYNAIHPMLRDAILADEVRIL